MSDPSTVTLVPESAASSVRPSAADEVNDSRPLSPPGTIPTIIGGTPMLTPLGCSSRSIITDGVTTSTPSTMRTRSAVSSDIGALEKPAVEPDASLSVILSA